MFRYFALFLLFIFFLAGCSTKGNLAYNKQQNNSTRKDRSYTSLLYKEYKIWKGTPYKLGANSLNGIDCSSFIQKVYENAFKIYLPRTTREQVKKGYRMDRNDSKAGDLIFFKTGYNVRHSGILIEKGKFMHASQKHGVIISDTYNPYWKNRYWQTRRVLGN